MEGEVQQGNLSGAVSTFTEGLAIAKSQYVGHDLSHPADLVTINIQNVTPTSCSISQYRMLGRTEE